MSRVEPTFFLKGIDCDRLIKDYQSGFFNRPIQKKQKLETIKPTSLLATSYSTDESSSVFTVRDRNNNNMIITTAGSIALEIFTKKGGELQVGGRCRYCGDDFDHTVMGVPVHHEESNFLLTNAEGQKYYHIVHAIWFEEITCSFECTLGRIRKLQARPLVQRDNPLADAERILRLWFRLTYGPDKILIQARDPALLKINGGPLERAEWTNDRHVYVRSERMLLIPAKVEYVRHQLTQ